MSPARIDHVIYAAGDLDDAARLIETELGLPVSAGGRHAELGTENRIVPLGGGYLELMAIATAPDSDLARALQGRLTEASGGLMAWCVAVDDIEAVGERLETAVLPITREGLTARIAGVGDSVRDPSLPFFIERDPGVPDPGAAGDAGGITWVEIAGQRSAVEERLGGHALPIRYVEGPPGIAAIGIGGREFRPR